jgi:hypothetical protein
VSTKQISSVVEAIPALMQLKSKLLPVRIRFRSSFVNVTLSGFVEEANMDAIEIKGEDGDKLLVQGLIDAEYSGQISESGNLVLEVGVPKVKGSKTDGSVFELRIEST